MKVFNLLAVVLVAMGVFTLGSGGIEVIEDTVRSANISSTNGSTENIAAFPTDVWNAIKTATGAFDKLNEAMTQNAGWKATP